MSFEQLMSQGVEAQASGAHEEALWYRQFAYFQAVEDHQPVAQARALRDGAASHSKLDQLDEALDAAKLSVERLDSLEPLLPGLSREKGASYDRLGRVMARIAIKDEQRVGTGWYSDAMRQMDTGWRMIIYSEKEIHSERSARVGGNYQWPACIDQYRINMAKDRAIVTGLHPRGLLAGLSSAVRATTLGYLSESTYIDRSNPDLSFKDRMKAHLRYAAAGMYAGALVAGLHVSPLRTRALKRADALLR